MMRLIPTLMLLVGTVLGGGRHKLTEVFAWKSMDYNFSSPKEREEALATGELKLERTLALGLEVWRDKLFLTVPRWQYGIPASLGYVNISSKEQSPPLIPYPDWKTNRFYSEKESSDTVHITSTYRIRADPCDRLWVIDSGMVANGTDIQKITAPQILIYDLKTDKLVRNYFLKPEDYKNNSFFANIAIDVTAKTCDDAFAYMPDLGGFGLIVYDYKTNKSWRVEHHYFYFDPLKGNYTIAGINFQWTDGAFGVSLSEVKEDGFRILYFHSLSSHEQFSVSTKYLRNETLSSSSFNQFKHLGSRGKHSQATGSYYHEKTGVIFYMEILKHAVTCWNTKSNVENNVCTVASDTEANDFIYLSDISGDGSDNIWFVVNNLPALIYRDVNISQFNYFVFKVPVKKAIEGTCCSSSLRRSTAKLA